MDLPSAPLNATFSASPEAVGQARHAVVGFAARAGADPGQLEAIRLAVSEAVTNAVVHGYRSRSGDVLVTAAIAADEIWILIGDRGGGMQGHSDTPGLGLGLALIARVADEMWIAPRAEGGTEVRMRFALVRTRARDRAPAMVRGQLRHGPSGRGETQFHGHRPRGAALWRTRRPA